VRLLLPRRYAPCLRGSGADVATPPLLVEGEAPPVDLVDLVDLVLERYRAGTAGF